jgi:hypothetical protein
VGEATHYICEWFPVTTPISEIRDFIGSVFGFTIAEAKLSYLEKGHWVELKSETLDDLGPDEMIRIRMDFSSKR